MAKAGGALCDPDDVTRALALSALDRGSLLTEQALDAAFADPSSVVRRRAIELAVKRSTPLAALLEDPDATVVDTAAWALGERAPARPPSVVVDGLIAVAMSHREPTCRESAVAALGALGDDRGLPAILDAAANATPAIRRRAVIALAPFHGDEVTATLERARTDRDRQVRQAAEDLLSDGCP